ncbi:hypothetical protein A2J03_21130 [Rhodococcus sp. EPR-157]|uniref:hypothetical protein n=1 Tax=Rhodococcus sp. EPR-157 TaxID=1813677 RepID=UPI0007BBE185|nr:hypothetical protein [Rhodococcus sp. EPR-157]KZF08475.1 hypothetical protein A2J03_21130 [Rhodococcus sp. EPR-157]
MTDFYWDRETRNTFQIIAKYAPAEGISRSEIASFGVRRQKQTIRDTTVLLAHGKILNVSKTATPRYVAAESQPCPSCGRA